LYGIDFSIVNDLLNLDEEIPCYSNFQYVIARAFVFRLFSRLEAISTRKQGIASTEVRRLAMT
jgi:hypothetical protein